MERVLNPLQVSMRKFLVALVVSSIVAWGLATQAGPLVGNVPQQVSGGKERPGSAFYQTGLQALGKKDYKAAEAAFQQSMQLDPRWYGPLLGLAETAIAQGASRDAKSWLRKAEALDPSSAHVQTALGRLYARWGQNVKAEAAYKKAIALDAHAFLPRIDLADLYLYALHRPAEAIEKYSASLEVEPRHAGAHYGLAMALAQARQPREAVTEFERASSLAPENPLPLLALGRLYFAGQEYDKSIGAYDRALKLKPDSAAVHMGRGEVFFATGQADRALSEYQAVLIVWPNSTLAYLKSGMILEQQKHFDEAAAAYRKVIEYDPKNAVAYNNLAWIAAERRSALDDALDWSKKAVGLAPSFSHFQDTLGWVYRSRGDLGHAAEVLEKAAARKPPDAVIHYHLGVVYSEQQRNEQALTALRKALEIDSGFSAARDAKRRIDALSKS